jgi:hypothetical protein
LHRKTKKVFILRRPQIIMNGKRTWYLATLGVLGLSGYLLQDETIHTSKEEVEKKADFQHILRPFPIPPENTTTAREFLSLARGFKYHTNMQDLDEIPRVVLVGMVHSSQSVRETIGLINFLAPKQSTVFVEGLDNYQETYNIWTPPLLRNAESINQAIQAEARQPATFSKWYASFNKSLNVYGNDTKELLAACQLNLNPPYSLFPREIDSRIKRQERDKVFLESIVNYTTAHPNSTVFQWVGIAHLERSIQCQWMSERLGKPYDCRRVPRSVLISGLEQRKIPYLSLHSEKAIEQGQALLKGKGTTSGLQRSVLEQIKKGKK